MSAYDERHDCNEAKWGNLNKTVAEFKKSEIVNNTTVFDKQVGGDHYKNMKIQPVDYIFANDLNFAEGCVVKYTTRSSYKRKAGDVNKAIQDLEKAIHYLEMQVELIKKELKNG